jgi:hypothetical protein
VSTFRSQGNHAVAYYLLVEVEVRDPTIEARGGDKYQTMVVRPQGISIIYIYIRKAGGRGGG